MVTGFEGGKFPEMAFLGQKNLGESDSLC